MALAVGCQPVDGQPPQLSSKAATSPPSIGERPDPAPAPTPALVTSTEVVAPAATEARSPDTRAPSGSRIEARLALGAPSPWPPASCALPDAEARARCLLDRRWRDVSAVHGPALALWDRHRVVIGLEPEDWMDGGFRGRVHLVPEAPVGPYERHLAWVTAAHDEIAEVLAQVVAKAQPARPMRFRHEGIVYGFFRSVGRTTPSAYAGGGRIGYNVAGSLHATGDAVRDTLFHEIVHLGDDEAPFSNRLLDAIHASIVAKCGTRTACLTPFAPTRTQVRGGTYYAFQPDNGDAVHEYAAEVATRWFQEQRAALGRGVRPGPQPFKCGPPENGLAWRAIAAEIFAGADLVPACR